jgi:hypothetical protein
MKRRRRKYMKKLSSILKYLLFPLFLLSIAIFSLPITMTIILLKGSKTEISAPSINHKNNKDMLKKDYEHTGKTDVIG